MENVAPAVSTVPAAPAQSAPQDPAVTPETVTTPPEGTEPPAGGKPPVEEKRLTQTEVDAIVQREKAKAEAKADRRAQKAYRETLERLIPQIKSDAKPADSDRPKQEQFASVDDYVEAVAEWKISQRDKATREQQEQEHQRTVSIKTESLYTKAAEISGFDREAFDALPLTAAIAAAVTESDIAPKLMAHMAANPEDVQRIAYLPPVRQAAEIGKLEAKILAAPPPPRPSNAPAPITPVGASKGTLEKNPNDMSAKEFASWRKKFIAQRH